MTTYFAAFWSLLVLTSLAAMRWGGRPERDVAAMYVAAAVCSTLLASSRSVRWHGVEAGVLAVDSLLLLGLALVAIRHDRWWTVCALSLQAFAVLAHLGKAMNPDLWRYGYQMMSTWSALPTVVCLAVGVAAEALRRRRRADRQT